MDDGGGGDGAADQGSRAKSFIVLSNLQPSTMIEFVEKMGFFKSTADDLSDFSNTCFTGGPPALPEIIYISQKSYLGLFL